MVRRLLELVVLFPRAERSNELELLALRHVRVLVLRLPRGNPSWGFECTMGELQQLGIASDAATLLG